VNQGGERGGGLEKKFFQTRGRGGGKEGGGELHLLREQHFSCVLRGKKKGKRNRWREKKEEGKGGKGKNPS